MVRGRFSQFELIAQRIFEGALGRLLGGDGFAFELATSLGRAMEDTQRDGMAAGHYEFVVNPVTRQVLEDRISDPITQLSSMILEMAKQSGLALSSEPSVAMLVDETLRPNQIVVNASFQRRVGDTTEIFEPVTHLQQQRIATLDAFLIVNGKRHVALDKPIVSIGRRIDNDVIIDVPIVSRRHAHIRWRYGRFVIYDLGSRGGITVNGVSCRECVLQPGDLISLAGKVSLIYGEGLERRDALPADHREGDQETRTFPAEG